MKKVMTAWGKVLLHQLLRIDYELDEAQAQVVIDATLLKALSTGHLRVFSIRNPKTFDLATAVSHHASAGVVAEGVEDPREALELLMESFKAARQLLNRHEEHLLSTLRGISASSLLSFFGVPALRTLQKFGAGENEEVSAAYLSYVVAREVLKIRDDAELDELRILESRTRLYPFSYTGRGRGAKVLDAVSGSEEKIYTELLARDEGYKKLLLKYLPG